MLGERRNPPANSFSNPDDILNEGSLYFKYGTGQSECGKETDKWSFRGLGHDFRVISQDRHFVPILR